MTIKKILGNLTDETHQEIMIIKATHKIKSVEETLRFLISIYKKDKIRQELDKEEHINNMDKTIKENIQNIY